MLGVWDSSVDLSLSWGEPLSIKSIFVNGIFQLTKQSEAEKQGLKSKLSTFEYLPRTIDIDGLGLCFTITYTAL